jgi:hypothetical protein
MALSNNIKILKKHFKDDTLTIPDDLFVKIALEKVRQAIESGELTVEEFVKQLETYENII